MRRLAVIGVLVLTSLPLAQDSAPANRRWPAYPFWRGPGTVPIRPGQPHAGNNQRIRVQLPPRLDWEFAVAPGAARPVALHDSTQTTYQLWVPPSYRHALPHPLILFLSAKAVPDEGLAFDAVCRKYGVLFAVAYQGGNDATPALRMQLALDVFDDLRRRMAVDTDRVYLAGFSEGARTACELAYAYPEFVGGVMAFAGASSLRGEPWLRDRVKERLSVALITGELDPVRREMEVVRHPVLRDQQMNAKLWTVPRLGHALPPPSVIEEVLVWLESGRADRQQLAATYPPTRMPEMTVPDAATWAKAVFDEASSRVKDAKARESGLMQLAGIQQRWRGTGAAKAAARALARHDEEGKVGWQEVYQRRQREYLALEAKAMDEYLSGPSPSRDLLRKVRLVQELIALYEQVEKHGKETPEGERAARRLKELRAMVPPRR